MNRPRPTLWTALLALALGTACQSTKSEETASSAADAAVSANSPALAQAEALARRFGPLMQGAWVRTDYLLAVQQTYSPLKSADAVGEISEIHINPQERRADSLVSGVGYGNHEGGSLTVYFRPGLQPTALPTSYRDYESAGSFAELSYELNAPDTALLLTTYNRQRRVINQVRYQRVRGARPDDLQALNLAVRQRLLAGFYSGTDSLGRPVQLQFGADGRLRGLKGFKQYDVNTDFAGAPVETDFLLLDAETKHRREMAFRRSPDSLQLYAIRVLAAEGDVPTLVRGRRLFALVKQR